jgi:hypothetical protein
MTIRYVAEREQGSDWAVVDKQRNIPVATGLDFDEAEQTAKNLNRKEQEEKSQYA